MKDLTQTIANTHPMDLAKFIKGAYAIIDNYKAPKTPEESYSMVAGDLIHDNDINSLSLNDFNNSISYLRKRIKESEKKAQEPLSISEYRSMVISDMFVRILKEYKREVEREKRDSQPKLELSPESQTRQSIISEFKGSYRKLSNHLKAYAYIGAFVEFVSFYRANWRMYKILEPLTYQTQELSNRAVDIYDKAQAIYFKDKRFDNEVNHFAKVFASMGIKTDDPREAKELAEKRCKAGIMMYLKINSQGSKFLESKEFKEYLNKEYNARKK